MSYGTDWQFVDPEEFEKQNWAFIAGRRTKDFEFSLLRCEDYFKLQVKNLLVVNSLEITDPQIGRLLHLGDLIADNPSWFALLSDPNKMDSTYICEVDTDLKEFPKESNKDPLDYSFGENAAEVFERWSKELKAMRDKLK